MVRSQRYTVMMILRTVETLFVDDSAAAGLGHVWWSVLSINKRIIRCNVASVRSHH